MTTTNKLTARNAKSMIGYTVNHEGEDLRILGAQHGGDRG